MVLVLGIGGLFGNIGYWYWGKKVVLLMSAIHYSISNLTFEIMAKQGLRGGENGLLGYIRRTTTLLRLEGY